MIAAREELWEMFDLMDQVRVRVRVTVRVRVMATVQFRGRAKA